MLEIRTFGGFSLGVDSRTVQDIGSRKAEAILVYLAMEARTLNRNVLKTLLWPESSEEHASTSLRVELSILRKRLGDYLEISRDAIKLKEGARIYLDHSDLMEKLACGQIEQALEIYRGDFLEGFQIRDSAAFEDWMRWEQERARASFLRALYAAISTAIESENYLKGQIFTKRLLELEPLDEIAHRKSMLLLALDGQRAAALGQYETCRAILQEELEAEPSPETQTLYAKILDGERPENLEPAVPEHNLPASQTSFIGRERELVKIGELIHDPACRLLTLVGLGGSGKTRLALQAAGKILRDFKDGVYFVPLETCYSADYLVHAIANALQFNIDVIASDLEPKIQLLDYLHKRSILLVLDGFEHLIEGGRLLSEILERAPRVQALVTSRQKLTLKAEWPVVVEGLSIHANYPGGNGHEAEAIRLFVERARQAQPGFQLLEDEETHALRICQLVEGMPLGIELAAAWTVVLSPGEIVTEMEKSLHFLSTSLQDVPEKHRSLHAAFDSSWQLLTDGQRETFCKLSVFQGGFDRQAALQVAGASLTQLSALLDKSLLRRDADGVFSMHNLLRQFAAEKLSELPEGEEQVYDRHCRYYLNLLAQREADFWGVHLFQARDEIGRVIDNIRAAIDRACIHWDSQAVRKALISLMSFYIVQGWHEGKDAFRDIACLRRSALAATDSYELLKDAVYLSARTHQAYFLVNLGQIEECEAISRECRQALKPLDMQEELSECLHNLGGCAHLRGECEVARELLEEAILLGSGCNYIFWPTYLLWLGHVFFLLGEYEQGLLSLKKCYEIFDRMGTLWGIAFALSKMGLAYDGLGEHSQAMSYHREALSIFERVGNQAGKGYSLSRMSMSAYFQGDYALAEKFGREGYQVFGDISHYWGMCTSLCRLGFAEIGLGEIEGAREYFVDALRKSRERQMHTLSLYALAGLACTLAQEEERQVASELFSFVKNHPQTAQPYLDQALVWMGNVDQAPVRGTSPAIGVEMESLDEVIEQALKDFTWDQI
jgi:predicted ATPase/DNA-binding SARP family transcriptional activator